MQGLRRIFVHTTVKEATKQFFSHGHLSGLFCYCKLHQLVKTSNWGVIGEEEPVGGVGWRTGESIALVYAFTVVNRITNSPLLYCSESKGALTRLMVTHLTKTINQ